MILYGLWDDIGGIMRHIRVKVSEVRVRVCQVRVSQVSASRVRISQVRVNQCGDVMCDSVWIVVGYWWYYEVC